MAMRFYEGVDGVARLVKKQYEGVAGIARKRLKSYEGVNGVARQYFGSDLVVYDGGDSVLEGEFAVHGIGASGAVAGISNGFMFASGLSFGAIHPETGQPVGGGTMAWCSIGRIDLTNYNTIHVIGHKSAQASTVYFGYDNTLEVTVSPLASVFINSETDKEVTLDVSDLNGEYYLVFYAIAQQSQILGYGYISKIWLD